MYSNSSAMNTAIAGAYLAEEDKKRREAENQPRQDNLLDTIGKIALAAGATAGAVVAGRRLAGGQNTSATFDLSKVAGEGVQNLRRAAAAKIAPKDVVPPSRPVPTTGVERQRQVVEDTIRARSERPQGVVTVNLPQPKTARDPWTGRETITDPFGLGTVPPRTQATSPTEGTTGLLEPVALSRRQAAYASAAGQEDFANQYLRNEGYTQANTLVDQQVSSNLNQVDQFVNAINSAEDQQTGRVKLAFQRNEDENLASIELAEDRADARLATLAQATPESAGAIEVDAAINTVASQRPDGMPLDQAEGFREFSQRATQRKNLLDVQDQMWAFEEQMETQGQKAQAWLNKQLEKQKRREPVLDIENKVYNLVGKAAEQGVDLEPSRALTLLTNPTAELTGVEQRLFGIDPSLGKFALKGQTFAPGQRQTGASLSVLGERLADIPNVGEDPRSFVTQAASGTSIRGRSRVPNVPDESRPRLSSSGRPVTADDVFIDEGGTVSVSPGEELTEMVFESKEPSYTRFARNPQSAEQRPAFFGPGFATAEQLKVGLSPEYAPKGMRAVQTKEGQPYFVPIGDPGGIGIYGEERRFASGPIVKFDDPEQERVAGAYTKTAMRAPTEMPFKEKQKGGAGFGDLSSQQLQSFIEKAPEGPMRIAGQKELAKREATKQSLAASELFRRGRIEGLF